MTAEAHASESPPATRYKQVRVGDASLFYREAGRRDRPTLLLLHGFPSSSHMFRALIPRLAQRYHVVAPDLPGFGFTQLDAPQPKLTFERLTDSIEGFVDALGLDRYAIYVFDYGAPVGLRLAVRHPQRVLGIISQNGNAYAEGLSEGWNPIQAYWKDPSTERRSALRGFLSLEATRWQYTHGVADPTAVAPEAYTLDALLMARPGNDEIQLDLFLDYASNVALYPAFQKYFRDHQPPLLAVWGRNDPFFLPPGAQAFKRDLPDAEIHLLDTGHFALETHAAHIGSLIVDFMDRRVGRGPYQRSERLP
jgi:pimeloyl-ACP methyl ester carboxylesterase